MLDEETNGSSVERNSLETAPLFGSIFCLPLKREKVLRTYYNCWTYTLIMNCFMCFWPRQITFLSQSKTQFGVISNDTILYNGKLIKCSEEDEALSCKILKIFDEYRFQ